MPSIRRYRQSYYTTLAAIATAAFESETQSKAKEVIKVIPAIQIEEDEPDKLGSQSVRNIYFNLKRPEMQFLKASAQINSP